MGEQKLIQTPKSGRLSFPALFTPRSFQEGVPPKYGVQVLLKKGDPEVEKFVKELQAVMQATVVEKWPDPKKRPTKLMSGLKDGDTLEFEQGGLKKEQYPEYEGHYIVTANSKKKVVVVDARVDPITEEEEVYGGCYGRIQFSVYANDKGKYGVFFGLRGVQKLADGESFGGGSAKFEPSEDAPQEASNTSFMD